MMDVRPGYWDIDRCSWVGTDPVYVVPPPRDAADPASAEDLEPETPSTV